MSRGLTAEIQAYIQAASDQNPNVAQTIEGDPAKTTKAPQLAGTQRTQNLVFPVTPSIDTPSIKADGADIALSPGMAVSVEIKTGGRRILEYVFSPLVATASRAMKER